MMAMVQFLPATQAGAASSDTTTKGTKLSPTTSISNLSTTSNSPSSHMISSNQFQLQLPPPLPSLSHPNTFQQQQQHIQQQQQHIQQQQQAQINALQQQQQFLLNKLNSYPVNNSSAVTTAFNLNYPVPGPRSNSNSTNLSSSADLSSNDIASNFNSYQYPSNSNFHSTTAPSNSLPSLNFVLNRIQSLQSLPLPLTNATTLHQEIPLPSLSSNTLLQSNSNSSLPSLVSNNSVNSSISSTSTNSYNSAPPIINAHLQNSQSMTSSSTSSLNRKYKCKICDKGFTTSGHLARHHRIHTGVKNHVCPFEGCNSRFSRQDNCMQHYKTHLKVKKNKKKGNNKVGK